MSRLKSGFLLTAAAGWVAAALGIALAQAVVWQLGILFALAGIALALAVSEAPSFSGHATATRASRAAATGTFEEAPSSTHASAYDAAWHADEPPFTDAARERASTHAPRSVSPRPANGAPRPRLARLPAPPSEENAFEISTSATVRLDEVEDDDFPFEVAPAKPARLPVTVAKSTNGNGQGATLVRRLDLSQMPLSSAALEGPAPKETAFTSEPVTRGVCSRCDTPIVLSARRPIRATCPVCGHSKILN